MKFPTNKCPICKRKLTSYNGLDRHCNNFVSNHGYYINFNSSYNIIKIKDNYFYYYKEDMTWTYKNVYSKLPECKLNFNFQNINELIEYSKSIEVLS